MHAMKKLWVLAFAAAMTPIAAAKVWVTVYQYDGKTPLATVDANHPNVYRDIMVGTRLTLVISSDANDPWGGDLVLPLDDSPYAKLSGRGYTARRSTYLGGSFFEPTYKDSCLDAAGTNASVKDYLNPPMGIGLEFINNTGLYITDGHPAYPGDWFVVDYCAEQVGSCNVELYGYTWGVTSKSPVMPAPPVVSPETLIQTLTFTHIPSRDFNGDAVVDFTDFARLAAHWHWPVDPKSGPEAALDLQEDGQVDLSDLACFCNYWLVRTDSNKPPAQSDTAGKP